MVANDAHNISTADENVPLSAIFDVIGTHARDVVSTALEHRPAASEGARAALNAAVDNSGIAIKGFKKPSMARPGALNDLVLLELFDGNDKLASAILRVWAEASPEIVRIATDHLNDKGVPIVERGDHFHAVWPKHECLLEGNMLSVQHSGFNHYDIALMLSYLSGRFPEDEVFESDLFRQVLDQMNDLSPDAPEWVEAPLFISTMVEMVSVKTSERNSTLREEFDGMLDDIAERFKDELRYLDVDISGAREDVDAHPDLIEPARVLMNALESALEAYAEIRPQADTREEELRRADEREEHEGEIYRVVHTWEELIAAADEMEDADEQLTDGPDAPADITVREYEALADAQQELAAENARLAEANAVLEQNRGKLQAEKEALAAENVSLTQANDALQHATDKLRMEKEAESNENSRLKRELRESKQREEAWRGAPAPTRSEASDAEGIHSRIESVRNAIAAAESNFSGQLVIALNSRSKEDTPFQRPSEVYDALAWLAADYRRVRSNPAGADPDFDKMLKEACPGWSYVPHQSAVTIGMFKDWYYTTAGGVKYELTEHLGRGSSGNPQYTIRIAFAWDADLGQVVVGYIGHHQRNQGS